MIHLRPANFIDTKFLLDLRNDPNVRANSFNQDVVSPEAHINWLSTVLTQKEHELFIIIDENGEKIGQVRFHLYKTGEAEINIALVAQAQGKGYGSEAVKQSSNLFLSRHPHTKILARIKRSNSASLKVFLKAGYLKEKEDEKGIIYLFFI